MSGKSKVCALPGCGNAGSAEDKLKVCGGCGDVAYCTVEHQREHWATHKGQCKQKHKKSTDPMESHLRRGRVALHLFLLHGLLRKQ
jgi:hypothetical protein